MALRRNGTAASSVACPIIRSTLNTRQASCKMSWLVSNSPEGRHSKKSRSDSLRHCSIVPWSGYHGSTACAGAASEVHGVPFWLCCLPSRRSLRGPGRRKSGHSHRSPYRSVRRLLCGSCYYRRGTHRYRPAQTPGSRPGSWHSGCGGAAADQRWLGWWHSTGFGPPRPPLGPSVEQRTDRRERLR